jgi:4a-hydroxytetrahydrobiopterin dehydratase
MARLAEMKCEPCRIGMPPMKAEDIRESHAQVPEWEVFEAEGEKRLRRSFDFKNFRKALDFTVKVGEAAEEEDHHPTLLTEWGKVTVTWWTHKIGGLHQNDFIMAARTDNLFYESRV